MTIYFVNTEVIEEDLFASGLAGHDVRFVRELNEVEPDAEIVSVFINEKVGSAFLDTHPRVKLIATRSSAVDHLDLQACADRDVAVRWVGAYGENTVAEHTFALILALSRRLREVMTLPRKGRFSYEATRALELAGKTLGIVGMGRIGQRVAALARGFEMKVIAHDVHAPPELALTLGFEFVPFEEILSRSHVLSLHSNLTADNYHLLNRDTLARCRPGVLIINTARGALIDTQALREALDSGHVGGAGLDVLQDERVMRDTPAHIIGAEIVKHLRSDAVAAEARDADRLHELQELMLGADVLSRTNVVFTPHVAFNSVEAIDRLHAGVLENITSFIAEQTGTAAS